MEHIVADVGNDVAIVEKLLSLVPVGVLSKPHQFCNRRVTIEEESDRHSLNAANRQAVRQSGSVVTHVGTDRVSPG